MFLLYHRSTYKTGRVIARCLGIPCGHLGKAQPERRFRRRLRQAQAADVVVRWGSSNDLVCGGAEINGWSAVVQAADKLRTFDLLKNSGVHVPPYTEDREKAGQWALSTTVLGRTRHGARGQGIVIYQPGDALAEHELYAQYVPNSREYRLHVFRGEIIRVQGKYLDDPAMRTSLYVKNHDQGYRFRTPRKELNRDRTAAAVNAVAALQLDFGAVDLIVGEDGRPYVLEVNTAPACSAMTVRAYVEKFAEVLGVEPDYSTLETLNG